ncbi:NAD(P)H-dependent flavin oxidoreductase [Leifsonia sp. YAF41]|uniref:NAD(P)H-dependent flavin oxidoreductase n=1 Tax=Leifsonia sp. YAF41 TaxID=3233086 RepID=UPI003F9B7180
MTTHRGTSSWRETRLTEMLGLRLPVVLGPFGGLSSVSLTAAVSNAGGLGSFGLYGYDAERIRQTAEQLRESTDQPFNLNLWLDHDSASALAPTDAEFAAWLEPMLPYFRELDVAPPSKPDHFLPTVEEQLDAVIEARPAVVSFVFGVPSPDMLDRCRSAGIRTVGTATTVAEAVALDAAGIDAIVASGFEAGGHRISFLSSAEDSLMGLFSLLPQVVDAVGVPVIAAGGIADGRGIAAALTLGADAAVLGTAFLTTDESAISPGHRERILSPDSARTVLTRVYSGRLARGIPNRMFAELSEQTSRLAPFPAQNWLSGQFKPAAIARQNTDLMALWAGQAAPLAHSGSASALMQTLEAETAALLD